MKTNTMFKKMMKQIQSLFRFEYIILALFVYLLYREFYLNVVEYFSNNDDGTISGNIDSNTESIPKSQIPEGDEDLYILKSKIVPPVCPKCPDIINTCKPDSSKCPPCPPCGRCPEPSFECKKVPTFNPDNSNLPRPVLNDFSQFGM